MRQRLSRAAACLSWGLLFAVFAVAANGEQLQVPVYDETVSVDLFDGVVVVRHAAGDTVLVRGSALDALPEWRWSTFFTAPAASSEAPAFTLFAHPAASATGFGFLAGPGEPPPIASSLADLDAALAGYDLFLSPLLWSHPDCGWVIENELFLVFLRQTSLVEQYAIIESVGGESLPPHGYAPPIHEIRVRGARSALEVLDVALQLQRNPDVDWIRARNAFLPPDTVGCGSGTVGGGTGGAGGGARPTPVPGPGWRALALLALLLVSGGIATLARR